MTVTQVKDLMNEVTKEVLGEENIVNENLSNVVDIGTQIFNSSSVDAYVKSLVNHIGRVIFVNRVYAYHNIYTPPETTNNAKIIDETIEEKEKGEKK